MAAAKVTTTQATTPTAVDEVIAFMQAMQEHGYISTNDHLFQQGWRMKTLAGKWPDGHLEAQVLMGPPGCGKSHWAKTFAKWWEARLKGLQFTTGIGREALMDDVNLFNVLTVQNGQWDTTKYGPLTPEKMFLAGILVQAIEASWEGRTVLLLDEMDKAKHQIDAMLLEFLNDGLIRHPYRGEVEAKRENLIVIATMNNERDLSEPLMRRFRGITLTWPDKELEWKLIRNGGRKFIRRYPELVCDGANEPPEGLCKALVTLANRIREQGEALSLHKVPSTPELVNACVDMMVTPNKKRRGKIAADWLFKYPEDRGALVQAKKFEETDEALAAIFAQF